MDYLLLHEDGGECSEGGGGGGGSYYSLTKIAKIVPGVLKPVTGQKLSSGSLGGGRIKNKKKK